MANTNHHLAGKKIFVIGSGIAGSTFVSALHINQQSHSPSAAPEITVFEQRSREACIQDNSHILTLYGTGPHEGISVLQKQGQWEALKADSTLISAYVSVWDEKWKFLSDIHPQKCGNNPSGAVRIERAKLMQTLVERAERVPNARFRWNCVGVAAERQGNGQIRLTVQDSSGTSTHDCDILILADGANSKLNASLRPRHAQWEYHGANLTGGISHLPRGMPAPIESIDTGGMQMSDGKNIYCHYTPLGNNTLWWALSQKGPRQEPKTRPISPSELETFKSNALAAAPMFAEPFKTIVQSTDSSTTFVLPAMGRNPFRHESSNPGIIFLGDANHVVNMYNSRNADLALQDGWDLAVQLRRNSSVSAAVAAYDNNSIPRVMEQIDFAEHRLGFGNSTGAAWKAFKTGMHAQRMFGKVGVKYRE